MTILYPEGASRSCQDKGATTQRAAEACHHNGGIDEANGGIGCKSTNTRGSVSDEQIIHSI